LNVGECFAYEVAREHFCRLLFVGDDFSKTDVGSVLEPRRKTMPRDPVTHLHEAAAVVFDSG
jgi:hypothetical protein